MSYNQANPMPKISRLGITSLFGNLNSQVDIVFVHGLNGQPAQTWLSSNTGFFWPLQLQPYLENARVLLFGYDADVSPSLNENRTHILGIAKKLLSSLANYRRHARERDRPLIFVGHSLGGLVIKAALVEAHKVLESKIDGWDRIYNSTGGVMLFGVPNAGNSASQRKLGKLNQRREAISTPMLLEQALRLHSLDTTSLAADFRRLPLCTKELLFVYSYYEERTTIGIGEIVVDEMSATIGYNREVLVPIQSDHESMVKFRDFDDSSFTDAVGQLLYIIGELLDRAAAQASASPASEPAQPPLPPRTTQHYDSSSSSNGPAHQRFTPPPPNPVEQAARNSELVGAAGSGDLARVMALHRAGADPNASGGGPYQPSALGAALATFRNNYDTANNGWYSSGGMAAIGNAMLAQARKCATVVRYLLDNGADWNSLSPNEQNTARLALSQ